MDHRVSKDMISSGMTPSGKKSQADLGKTQYGSAPSPSRLMDAYQSMYDKKEEVINEMKLGDVSGSADFASRNIKGAKGASKPPTPEKTGRSQEEIKKSVDQSIQKGQERAEKREKLKGIMSKYGESVDLLAAYQSIYVDTFEEGKIPAGLQAFLDKKKGKKKDDDNGDDKKEGKKKSKKGKGGKPDFLDLDKDGDKKEPMKKASKEMKEHHQKDKNGNTIPHEGEEINEEPVTATLLALGKLAGSTAAKAAASGAGKALASTAAKKGIGAAAKKGTMMVGKKIGGTQGAKIGARAADAFGKMDNFSKVQVGQMALNTASNVAKAPVNLVKGLGSNMGVQQGKRASTTGTISASADLFDIVKGKLLDGGLNEEEIKNIMLELTPDEILSEMDYQEKPNIKPDVPQDVRDAAKRQYKAGTPREDKNNPYTTADKKKIINQYKNN